MMDPDRGDVLSFNRLLLLAGDVFPPQSATTRAQFAAQSRRGSSHAVNDDHYLVSRLGRTYETLFTSLSEDAATARFDECAYAMVVADGMGEAGEAASRLAISALVELALRFGEWRVRVADEIAPDIIERIHGFYRQIDAALVHANRSHGGAPLHTTLTAAVSGGRGLFFAHVGHSRAYLLRDGELYQVTRDHTHAVRRSSIAGLVELTGTPSDRNHVLTDALGAGAVDPHIDIERLTLLDGDIVMLCSNGLTDVVPDHVIAEVLDGTATVADQCASLIAHAVDRGAPDDVTVVLARYQVPE
jgi:PPM family protein phosphatase